MTELFDPESAQDSLPSDLSVAVVRMSRRLRGRRVSPISLTQLSAVMTLSSEGPLTPGVLAQLERVQPPSMTRVIASLVDAGLVQRTAHPTDGRQIVVTLTDAGQELLNDERNAREKWLRTELATLSDEQRATLRAAVEIIDDLVSRPS